MSATPATVITQLVETMRALAGSHPGFRPVHAKGIVCSGTFRGATQARGVSRAPHLQGQAVPTIVRFDLAAGIRGRARKSSASFSFQQVPMHTQSLWAQSSVRRASVCTPGT